MTAQEVKIEELEATQETNKAKLEQFISEKFEKIIAYYAQKIRFGKLPDWKFRGWQVVFFFGTVPDPELPIGLRLGWKTILFGTFKVKELPPEGQEIQSENIRGFIIQGQVWFPFDRFGKL